MKILVFNLQSAKRVKLFADERLENFRRLMEMGCFGELNGDAHDARCGWKKRLRQALTWFKLRRYFSQLLDVFQACTVASEKEPQLLQQIFPAHKKEVMVLLNCVNVKDYENIRAESCSNQWVFMGSFRYHTNYEAMVWFVRDVFPMVLEKVPQAQLVV